jgi:hypothetical protein
MKVKILVILIVMGLVTLACGGFGQSEDTESAISEQSQATELIEEVGEIVIPTEPNPTPELMDTPTQAMVENVVEAFEIASWEELESFHLEWSWVLVDQAGAEIARYTITQEYDRGAEASHITVSMPDEGVFMETIVIGDQGWMSMVGMDAWFEMDIESGLEAVDLHDWGGFWAEAEEVDFVGLETVNGVETKHFMLADRGSFYLTNPQDATMLGFVTAGEVWIANQPDLPPVDVRGRMKVREGFFPFPTGDDAEAGEIEMFWEYDLTYINEPVNISPPE